MELSQRIKNARLEAGLSQRQLCAGAVTRNMLSLIESGKARPSMDTLRHFSQILGKPMSYFLDEDTVTSPNQQVMQAAEAAYEAGNFSAVLATLEDYCAPDAVFDQTRYLLELLSCEALAEQAVADGKNTYALRLLDRADALAANTIYAPDPRRSTLLRYRADPSTAANTRLPIADEMLLHAEAALLAQDFTRAAQLLDVCPKQPPRWGLLRGAAALRLGDTRGAVEYLQAAQTAFPAEASPLLEQAYLAQGDYRRAYEYAKRAAGNEPPAPLYTRKDR